jgi:hypothetical protein
MLSRALHEVPMTQQALSNSMNSRRSTKPEADVARLLVTCMSVNDKLKRKIYYLGSHASRVSFASQQTRALNLVWSLHETQEIEAGDTVAVIGGGVAGLMAAAALISTGCRVSVFEKESQLCSVQKRTDKRIIHPSINAWPHHPLRPTTNYPFLNWACGTSRTVIADIMYQWCKYFSAAEVERNVNVVDVKREADCYKIELQNHGNYDRDFDAVIVAVGFGTEKSIEGAVNCSYWTDFDPVVLVDSKSPRLMVSGTGDGGCIDVMRAALPAFDQGYLAIELAKIIDRYPALVRTITAIENAVESADYDAAEGILESRYTKLGLPAEFTNKLLEGTDNRPIKDVSLLHMSATPYDRKAAPIHRLMLKEAIRKKVITPIRGELKSGPRRAYVIDAAGDKTPLRPDMKALVRHGVKPGQVLQRLDKPTAARLTNADLRRFVNIVGEVSSPASFYYEQIGSFVFPSMTSNPNEFKNLLEYLSRSILAPFGIRYITDVNRTAAGDVFHVRCPRGELISTNDLPGDIFGLTIQTSSELNIGTAQSSGPHKRVASTSKPPKGSFRNKAPSAAMLSRPNLQPGARITGTNRNRYGTLGCFLKHSKDASALYALTVSHIFDLQAGHDVYADFAGSEHRIGQCLSRQEVQRLSGGKTFPQFAFTKVDPDCPIDVSPPKVHLTGGVLDLSRISLGSNVTKISHNGLSHGIIDAVAVDLAIRGPTDMAKHFTNLLEIHPNGPEFALPGDSGAPVVTDEGLLAGLVVASAALGSAENRTYLQPLNEVLLGHYWSLATQDEGEADIDTIISRLDAKKTSAVIDELAKQMVRSEGWTAVKGLAAIKASERETVAEAADALAHSTGAAGSATITELGKAALRRVAKEDSDLVKWLAVAATGALNTTGLGALIPALVILSMRNLIQVSDISEKGGTLLEVALKKLIEKAKEKVG